MDEVHLAKDCRAVAAIGGELRKISLRAPAIKKVGFRQGAGPVWSFLAVEWTIVVDGKPVAERYFAAVDVLAAMHARTLSRNGKPGYRRNLSASRSIPTMR
jgi:aminoglycoside/choline kinase family phosphotransferase